MHHLQLRPVKQRQLSSGKVQCTQWRGKYGQRWWTHTTTGESTARISTYVKPISASIREMSVVYIRCMSGRSLNLECGNTVTTAVSVPSVWRMACGPPLKRILVPCGVPAGMVTFTTSVTVATRRPEQRGHGFSAWFPVPCGVALAVFKKTKPAQERKQRKHNNKASKRDKTQCQQ